MKLHFFSKGLTHDFRQKLQISSMFFDSTSQGIMSHDHLVKKKRPPSLYKYGFHVVMILNFFKVVKRWLSSKNENLTVFVFEQNGLWKNIWSSSS